MVVAKLIIFIVIGLSSVFAEYTEEDVKNMKMVFCGKSFDNKPIEQLFWVSLLSNGNSG